MSNRPPKKSDEHISYRAVVDFRLHFRTLAKTHLRSQAITWLIMSFGLRDGRHTRLFCLAPTEHLGTGRSLHASGQWFSDGKAQEIARTQEEALQFGPWCHGSFCALVPSFHHKLVNLVRSAQIGCVFENLSSGCSDGDP